MSVPVPFGRARLLAGALALALAPALASCGADEPPVPRDLVVVVLDALPASSVSSYGYERPTTPHLDDLAAAGQRFAQAHTTASYTLASTASLFTGMSPRAHGAEREVGHVLGADRVTLAEVLGERGFATAAFSLNPQVSRETGFAQGFDVFEYAPRDDFTYNQLPQGFLERVTATWQAQAGERRFLYVHLLPPHVPYTPPPPFNELFGARKVDHSEGGQSYLRALNMEAVWLTPDDPRVVRAKQRYDATLAYADAQLDALLDALGPLDDVALVVTSDHGEAFGEHGRILHGSMASKEMIHVPLVLHGPGLQGDVRDDLVRTRDLAATVCEWLDVPWDARMAHGRSFLRAPGLDPLPARGALSRSVGTAPLWALRTDDWTYIRATGSGREELYDRRNDPLEVRDLAADPAHAGTRAELAAALDTALARERDIGARFATAETTDAHRAALEDIGYFESEED